MQKNSDISGAVLSDDLVELAGRLGQRLSEAGHMLALAESCTGGWIAQSVTEIAGSSVWFDRGFVTYSNSAKTAMLGVRESTLQQYGAVSPQTASEMAAGALAHSAADIALAVTGIAGPGGGTAEKPVGLVFIAWQRRGQPCRCRELHFEGDRHAIRRQTVVKALRGLLDEYRETDRP
ncbi:CinA family protein [Methylomicrobium sp. RS1]|jgi:nicotinamide-nucleotide amidase|uniref:CinA family protein n=1 Tax=Candidatus Methylomicrobium oryzae TaxID=2802053 RepID=UPI001920C5AF|nr:CinA family protein [Methylomicrobium sp. RS1]MBL1264651.1 CinA family protein [Methylomicrobium sp. RS1]